MPFNIGPGELILILIIALVVLGPGKLPEVASSLGKSLREFRKAASDVSDAARVDPPAPQPAIAAPQAPVAPAPQPAVAPAPAPAPNTLSGAAEPNALAAAPAAPIAAAPIASDAPAPDSTNG
jgi:TatA/E family protein of Tat protein translocase